MVEAWLGAFNRHDAESCAALCADDVHFMAAGGREEIDGRRVLATDLALSFERWSQWTLTPHRWTCDGENVVVEVHNYAICDETGKRREAEDCMAFVVRNGRIVELDFYFDSAATRDANTRDAMVELPDATDDNERLTPA